MLECVPATCPASLCAAHPPPACCLQEGICYDYAKVINIGHLEKYFAEPAKKVKKIGDPNSQAPPAVISVLNAARTQSVGAAGPTPTYTHNPWRTRLDCWHVSGIFVQKMKLPNQEIVRLILSCDASVMKPEEIDMFMKQMPTPEEVLLQGCHALVG